MFRQRYPGKIRTFEGVIANWSFNGKFQIFFINSSNCKVFNYLIVILYLQIVKLDRLFLLPCFWLCILWTLWLIFDIYLKPICCFPLFFSWSNHQKECCKDHKTWHSIHKMHCWRQSYVSRSYLDLDFTTKDYQETFYDFFKKYFAKTL